MKQRKQIEEMNLELLEVLQKDSTKNDKLSQYLNTHTLSYDEVKFIYKLAIRKNNSNLYEFIAPKLLLKENDLNAFFYESILKNSFDVTKKMFNQKVDFNYVGNKNTNRTVLNVLAIQSPLNIEMMDELFSRHNWSETQLISALDESISSYCESGFHYLLDKLNYKLNDDDFTKHVLRKLIASVDSKTQATQPNYHTKLATNYINNQNNLSEKLATNVLQLCNSYTPLEVLKAIIEKGADINDYDSFLKEGKTHHSHKFYQKIYDLPANWGNGEVYEYLKDMGLNDDKKGIFTMLYIAGFDTDHPTMKYFLKTPSLVKEVIEYERVNSSNWRNHQHNVKLNKLISYVDVMIEKDKLNAAFENPLQNKVKKGMKL
jgi:hypothetical protein